MLIHERRTRGSRLVRGLRVGFAVNTRCSAGRGTLSRRIHRHECSRYARLCVKGTGSMLAEICSSGTRRALEFVGCPSGNNASSRCRDARPSITRAVHHTRLASDRPPVDTDPRDGNGTRWPTPLTDAIRCHAVGLPSSGRLSGGIRRLSRSARLLLQSTTSTLEATVLGSILLLLRAERPHPIGMGQLPHVRKQ